MVIAIRVGDRDAGFPHPPPAFLTYDPALACPQLLVTDGEEYGRRWEKDEDGIWFLIQYLVDFVVSMWFSV